MYNQTFWKDRVTEHPKRRRIIDAGGGLSDLEDAQGKVYQNGTPMSAANFNNMEDGIQDAALAGAILAAGLRARDDAPVAFEKAGERTELTSGDRPSALFGKIKKWFSDLKSVAFTGKYSDLTGTPSIPAASDANPKGPGAASPGSGTTWARGDHVHPAQTDVTGSSGSCTGNAASATKLYYPRNINGVSFDGTRDINILDGTKLRYLGIVADCNNTYDPNSSIIGMTFWQWDGNTQNSPLSAKITGFGVGTGFSFYSGPTYEMQVAWDFVGVCYRRYKNNSYSFTSWEAVVPPALPLSGGTLNGKLYANAGVRSDHVEVTNTHGFRSVFGEYGVFTRNDGTDFYCMITNPNDQYGGYRASGWPFYFHLSDGYITFPSGACINNLKVTGSVTGPMKWGLNDTLHLVNVQLSGFITNNQYAYLTISLGKPVEYSVNSITVAVTGDLYGVNGSIFIGKDFSSTKDDIITNLNYESGMLTVVLSFTPNMPGSVVVNQTPVCLYAYILDIIFSSQYGDEPMPGPEIFADRAGEEGPSVEDSVQTAEKMSGNNEQASTEQTEHTGPDAVTDGAGEAVPETEETEGEKL